VTGARNYSAVLLLVACQDATAGDRPMHRFSCTLARLYVAKYSLSAAEAWARSHGATDVEIETARQCLKVEARENPSRLAAKMFIQPLNEAGYTSAVVTDDPDPANLLQSGGVHIHPYVRRPYSASGRSFQNATETSNAPHITKLNPNIISG
jgi:hypothetical protein